MVPSAFVFLGQWPLTVSGKLDRKALPTPEQTREAFIEPRTPLEKKVADVWKAVLGVERVGLNDSFFDLAGHSLSTVRMVNHLADQLTVNRVPMTLVFQAPTLALFAEALDQHGYVAAGARRGQSEKASRRVIPRLPRGPQGPDGSWVFPVSFAQRRLWLIDQLNPHISTYNVPSAACLSGNLNVSALARSLAEVVRRHESLRTTFRAGPGGEPLQVIGPAF